MRKSDDLRMGRLHATSRGSVEREGGLERAGIVISVGVRFRTRGSELLLEAQACHGLERWLDSFDRVCVAAVVEPESWSRASSSYQYIPVRELPHANRCEFVPLPPAWRFSEFRRQRRHVARLLGGLIDRYQYSCFAFDGYTGCWGRVGASQAIARGRAFAVWIERVETSVGWVVAKGVRGKLKFAVDSVPRWISDRALLPKASAVLCQGQDTLLAYRRHNPRTYPVTNVHTRVHMLPSVESIRAKAMQVSQRTNLRLCYAGRVAPEKGPLHWVRGVHHAVALGADVHAIWYGDGPMREQALALVRTLGLDARIQFPGFVADRGVIMSHIREADGLLFTHVSREPSRILVEALNMGTPIVGFSSERAKELVREIGGGAFSPMKDDRALGECIAALSRDRTRLESMVLQAGEQGRRYTAEAVFRERSERIISEIDRDEASRRYVDPNRPMSSLPGRGEAGTLG